MTNIPPGPVPESQSWSVHEAKARLSELIRRAQHEGPQRVTVHGRNAVVVVGVEDFERLSGQRSAVGLIELCARAPHRDIDLASERVAGGPVRDVEL